MSSYILGLCMCLSCMIILYDFSLSNRIPYVLLKTLTFLSLLCQSPWPFTVLVIVDSTKWCRMSLGQSMPVDSWMRKFGEPHCSGICLFSCKSWLSLLISTTFAKFEEFLRLKTNVKWYIFWTLKVVSMVDLGIISHNFIVFTGDLNVW